MQTKANSWTDPGLFVLEMLLRLRGIHPEPEQLLHLAGHGNVGVAEMLRCARDLGLKARSLSAKWEQLSDYPLPGIAGVRHGGFLLLGRATSEQAVILAPDSARPRVVTRAEFEALWDGRLVLATKRGPVADKVGKWREVLTQGATSVTRRVVHQMRRLAEPNRVKQAAQIGTNFAGAAVIDFTERARTIGYVIRTRKRGDVRRYSDELAFLPAALEISETPPSPLGRAIAVSVMSVFCVALVWACLGSVDIVAVAQGKIVPSGGTKIVQPFETGVVRAIRVHDGQSVKAGDVLIDLDATGNAADFERLKSDLVSARLDAARLRAAIANKDDPLSAFIPPEGAAKELIQMHRRFLASQTAEQKAKLAAIDRQISEKKAEGSTIQASIDKLKATITPLQQRVDIREQLAQKGLGSRLTYLSELQELVGQRQEVAVQESRINQAKAAYASLTEIRKRTVAENERSLFDGLSKAQQKAAGLAQDVIKAEQRKRLQTLTASVDGIVQQLSIHTVGGVVTPAQTLMLIVPAESHLEIEAMVSNRDIGFVESGQEAAIKVDTFNFTRYGLLHGRILSVSQDAITRDRPHDQSSERAQDANADSSEPKGQQLVYAARVSVDKTQLQIDNRRVNLSPGMAVTVEVKTGARSIISYLLSPLMRYAHDSLRER